MIKPYFGGKSTIADKVWQSLGDVARYIEPFFGSGAVLLARPNWTPDKKEIVNDKDCFITNVWRGIQFNPDEVAKWCDWPCNHVDLSARKMELIKNQERLREGLLSSPTWCDPVLAGYWVWCASNWIGSGLTRIGSIPQLSQNAGIGQISHLAGEQGTQSVHSEVIYAWMRRLSNRLRDVKVTCGDWTIVCGGNWQDDDGVCGYFFDSPYTAETGRDTELYQEESGSVAKDVAKWSLERGKSKLYRIVLAGYYQEHEWLLKEGWSVIQYSRQGGYANRGKTERKKARHKEALFLSPYCQKVGLL